MRLLTVGDAARWRYVGSRERLVRCSDLPANVPLLCPLHPVGCQFELLLAARFHRAFTRVHREIGGALGFMDSDTECDALRALGRLLTAYSPGGIEVLCAAGVSRETAAALRNAAA